MHSTKNDMDWLPNAQDFKVHEGRGHVRIQLMRRIALASSSEEGLIGFNIGLIFAFGPVTVGALLAKTLFTTNFSAAACFIYFTL